MNKVLESITLKKNAIVTEAINVETQEILQEIL